MQRWESKPHKRQAPRTGGKRPTVWPGSQGTAAVSPDTVIRAQRAAPDPPPVDVRVVGLDEWAKRKGRPYATVVVDQERHPMVDVLPDVFRQEKPGQAHFW